MKRLIRWFKDLFRKPCEHLKHSKYKIYGQTSFWCADCGYWGPWHERPKRK